MNVASLELCKELYELSGWVETQNYWKSLINHAATEWKPFRVVDFNGAEIPEAFGERTYPAYDLGYLLRNLPQVYEEKGGVRWILKLEVSDGIWDCYYVANVKLDTFADTPEDATAKLAVELFKQGVLSHDNQ